MALTVELDAPAYGKYTQPIGLFINGEFVEGVDKKKFEVINPATEEVITSVCEATEKDVDVAVAAARKVFNTTWRKTATVDRGRMLLKLADLIDRDAEKLAAVESYNNGKPIALATGELQLVSACIRYYGGYADKIHGKTVDVDSDYMVYTKQEPLGVCAQIIPWNFPLLMLAWKIGPSLATGNAVILKSSEQTPLTALLIAELINEAGFPAGVYNIISGFGKTAGAAMASHMDIDKVAFTGSTLTGRAIMKAAASSNLKKVTLELGGKSPNIVFDDADIDQAVSWVNYGMFYNQSQTCSAGTRIYVQEGIYDKFIAAFKKRVLENKVGDPAHPESFQGPQISQLQFDRIMGYIDAGKSEGAKLEIGGERHGDKGYFIKPTIFSDVGHDMKIMREEIFGPVAAVAKFKDEEDVLRMSNDSTYGLASAIHTKDLDRAIRVSNDLHAGTVWVNNYNFLHAQIPFGGYKQSGIGRELGEEALNAYLQNKSVTIRIGGGLSPIN
ncbi:hypothetical protein ACHAPE_005631 [Trichoderma viride]